MSVYSPGTATVVNGSNEIILLGMTYAELSVNVQAGDLFIRTGDVVVYSISSIHGSLLKLYLTVNYGGASGSGLAYGIYRDFTPELELPSLFGGDKADWPAVIQDAWNKLEALSASILTPYVSKSADYTLTDADHTVSVDASGGNKTMSLPTAVGRSGKKYNIKKSKSDSSGNLVIIDPYGAQTIDGETSISLSVSGEVIRIQSNGSNWEVV